MKKLSILLAVVVLAAAIGIGVLVSQKNDVQKSLKLTEGLLESSQRLHDDTKNQLGLVETDLEATRTELMAAKAELLLASDAATTTAADLGSLLEAKQAEFDAAQTGFEAEKAALTASLKEENARVLGLRLMLDNANKAKEAAAAKSAELLALVDSGTTEQGKLTATLDTALSEKAALEASLADLEAVKAALETQVADLESKLNAADSAQAALEVTKAELESKLAEADLAMDALNTSLKEENARVLGLRLMLDNAKKAQETAEGKLAELTAAMDSGDSEILALTTARDEAQSAKDALTAQVTELEGKLSALTAELDTLKAELENQALLSAAHEDALLMIEDLQSEVLVLETAKTDLEAQLTQPAAQPQVKHGLGMATSIGSLADATAEKPGSAQVNTAVCSLVLDGEGKILSVTWDMQQTKVSFSEEGKPVDLPETFLTKLEKGDKYGLIRASQIGKEWYEQIEAFAAFCIGKTVEEVLTLPTVEGDPAHLNVEELATSVTIGLGEYLETLKKAADNAK